MLLSIIFHTFKNYCVFFSFLSNTIIFSIVFGKTNHKLTTLFFFRKQMYHVLFTGCFQTEVRSWSISGWKEQKNKKKNIHTIAPSFFFSLFLSTELFLLFIYRRILLLKNFTFILFTNMCKNSVRQKKLEFTQFGQTKARCKEVVSRVSVRTVLLEL